LTDRHARRLIGAAAFGQLLIERTFMSAQIPFRLTHVLTLLDRLEADEDRIAVWRDVLAATNGARIKAIDVDNGGAKRLSVAWDDALLMERWLANVGQSERLGPCQARWKAGFLHLSRCRPFPLR
jgi:hypothetical protein